ncbi:MAG: thioredoxin domain-containing protein [Armatimonadetes bacterium]|nr:thioredoxin domain-containing protein [Anaerolineae bacterium]
MDEQQPVTLPNDNVSDTPFMPVHEAPEQPKNAMPVHPMIDLSRLTVNYTVIALVFLGIGILLGRLIFGQQGGNLDEVALRTIVNEALAEAGALGGGQAMTASVDDDPTLGSATAAITIVEFSDFNCGYCSRFANNTLPQILETYGDSVRYVYRDMPIIGEQLSVEAAVAAECANEQGKFWEFHNILFANPEARTPEAYVGFATELSLDTTAFSVCMADKTMSDEVMLDLLDGQALGIRGTPAFYVNGRYISGAQPFATFQAVIDSELNKAGVALPTG